MGHQALSASPAQVIANVAAWNAERMEGCQKVMAYPDCAPATRERLGLEVRRYSNNLETLRRQPYANA